MSLGLLTEAEVQQPPELFSLHRDASQGAGGPQSVGFVTTSAAFLPQGADDDFEVGCCDSPWVPLAALISPAESSEQTLGAPAAAVEELQQEAPAEKKTNDESSGSPEGEDGVVHVTGSDMRLHSGSNSRQSSSGSSTKRSSRSRCSSSMRISSVASSRSSTGGISCGWASGESEGLGVGGRSAEELGGCSGASVSVQRTVGEGFYKTKMCHFFQRGLCIYGNRCSYAHDPSEIRQPINLRKTRLCVSFSRGVCRAVDCKFAHGQEELRHAGNLYKTQLCLFWLSGKCGAGRNCRHAHGEEELVQKPQSPGDASSTSLPVERGRHKTFLVAANRAKKHSIDNAGADETFNTPSPTAADFLDSSVGSCGSTALDGGCSSGDLSRSSRAAAAAAVAGDATAADGEAVEEGGDDAKAFHLSVQRRRTQAPKSRERVEAKTDSSRASPEDERDETRGLRRRHHVKLQQQSNNQHQQEQVQQRGQQQEDKEKTKVEELELQLHQQLQGFPTVANGAALPLYSGEGETKLDLSFASGSNCLQPSPRSAAAAAAAQAPLLGARAQEELQPWGDSWAASRPFYHSSPANWGWQDTWFTHHEAAAIAASTAELLPFKGFACGSPAPQGIRGLGGGVDAAEGGTVAAVSSGGAGAAFPVSLSMLRLPLSWAMPGSPVFLGNAGEGDLTSFTGCVSHVGLVYRQCCPTLFPQQSLTCGWVAWHQQLGLVYFPQGPQQLLGTVTAATGDTHALHQIHQIHQIHQMHQMHQMQQIQQMQQMQQLHQMQQVQQLQQMQQQSFVDLRGAFGPFRIESPQVFTDVYRGHPGF